MDHGAKPKYGEPRWTNYISAAATLVLLPATIMWTALTAPFASHNKDKTWRRILGDSTLRRLMHLDIPVLQKYSGTTLKVYGTWAKQNKIPVVADELGEDARLLWIGPKQLDRVILMFHGGGFVLPLSDFVLSFWRYVQVELEKRNIKVGIAVLNYTLVPTGSFPIQLKQAHLALEFLLAAGVKPQNLQIAGDSAGGNLILQLFSHILHPHTSVPKTTDLPGPFSGICLISPWVFLTADSPCHSENEGIDYLPVRSMKRVTALVMDNYPETDRAFVEAAKAPEGWFEGVDRIANRVLITAGSVECLRDDIVIFGEGLKKHHPKVELVVQKGGLHDDMFLDFFVKEKKLGSLTPLIVEWLAAGFVG
ncbi:Alpha/Beta hydrolase protein [Mycena rebaudengoi]|nr:Alpha/Beta hydrolase protein [Mycena rebaudengoi]